MSEPLSSNLQALRRLHGKTQEQVAGALGVSRQAVAKWESGEAAPDLHNCAALAALYGVTLDDLVYYDARRTGLPVPPRGKHLFGTVTLGEKGQIVIPKRAREVFGLAPGDRLAVLGDESQGLALVPADALLRMLEELRKGGAPL